MWGTNLAPGGFTNPGSGARVDFTITVPQTCDVQITTRSGNIQVNDISGKMSLLSNAGSIRMTDASLSESSTVKTYVGSISL